MRILVRPGCDSRRGYLYAAGCRAPCVLGKNGTKQDKCEGDGTTPIGRFPLRMLLYRRDRRPVMTCFTNRCLRVVDGWCDDPGHRDYNRLVRRPHAGHCEKLWRSDRLYDMVFVIGYNDCPARGNRGSALFIHEARTGGQYTEGCVAVPRPVLRWLATKMRRRTWIEIKPAWRPATQKSPSQPANL